jgi:hypothetical protein
MIYNFLQFVCMFAVVSPSHLQGIAPAKTWYVCTMYSNRQKKVIPGARVCPTCLNQQ